MGYSDIAARLDAALTRHAPSAILLSQARAVMDRRLALYRAMPLWCVPEVPRRALRALGGPDALGDGLAAACLLFNGAADVIDDAQDDELAWAGFGWKEAINVGNFLLFLSSDALLGLDVSASVARAWAALFARSGARLTSGQAIDMSSGPASPLAEDDVLALGADKAGAALGCFMALAPLWAGRTDVDAWEQAGVTMGLMFQIVSDVLPYMAPVPHADLAHGKLTLPLLYARDVDPAIAELWADGPLDAPAQAALRERVAGSGAILYTQMRVEVLKTEVETRLAALDCPPLPAALAPVMRFAAVDAFTGAAL